MSESSSNNRLLEIVKKNKSLRKDSDSELKRKKKKPNCNDSFLLRQSCAISKKNKQLIKSLTASNNLNTQYDQALRKKEASEMSLMIKLNSKVILIKNLEDELKSCENKFKEYEDFLKNIANMTMNFVGNRENKSGETATLTPSKLKLPQRVKMNQRQFIKKWKPNLCLLEEGGSPLNDTPSRSPRVDQQPDQQINVDQQPDQQIDVDQQPDQQVDVDQQPDQQTDVDQLSDQQNPFLNETPFDPEAFQLDFGDETVVSNNDVTMEPNDVTVTHNGDVTITRNGDVTMETLDVTINNKDGSIVDQCNVTLNDNDVIIEQPDDVISNQQSLPEEYDVIKDQDVVNKKKRKSRRSSARELRIPDILNLVSNDEAENVIKQHKVNERKSRGAIANKNTENEIVILDENKEPSPQVYRRRTRQSINKELNCDATMVKNNKENDDVLVLTNTSTKVTKTATKSKKRGEKGMKEYVKRTGAEIYNTSNADSFIFDSNTRVSISSITGKKDEVKKRAMSDISNESTKRMKQNEVNQDSPKRQSTSDLSGENEIVGRRSRRGVVVSYKEPRLNSKKRREWTESELKNASKKKKTSKKITSEI